MCQIDCQTCHLCEVKYILVNEKCAWEANVISSHPMTEQVYAWQRPISSKFTMCNTFYFNNDRSCEMRCFVFLKTQLFVWVDCILDVASDGISLCFSVLQTNGLTRTWRCTSALLS